MQIYLLEEKKNIATILNSCSSLRTTENVKNQLKSNKHMQHMKSARGRRLGV